MLHRALLLAALAVPAAAQFDEEKPGPLTVDQLVERVQQRMKEHNYFAKVLVTVDRSQPPLLFFLHKPQVEDAGWDQRIVATHAPWLAKIEQLFRKNYVEPLGWKRREDAPAYPVCELQTEGDYVNFLGTQADDSFNAELAHYDRRLRATVSFHATGKIKPVDQRCAELAEFVRQLLAAHNVAGKDAPAQAWVVDGLGGYLADHTGDDPKVLDQRRIDPEMVAWLVRMSQQPQGRDVYLLPIAELANTRGIDQVWSWMRNHTEQYHVTYDPAIPWYAMHAQSVLWMHYLHDGDDAKYRPALMKFLTSVMGGGPDTFKSALEGTVLPDLDRAFYRWLYAKFEATHAGEKLERRWIDELFVARTGAAVASAAAAPDFSDLRPSRDDTTAEHGALLQAVRHGELEAALKQLGELEQRAHDGPFGRRIASDVERVKHLITVRDAYLAEMIATGGKLDFEYEGKKVSAKPVRVDNGLIVLGENRQKLASVPLSTLEPIAIAREFPKSIADGSDGWIRAYIYVLAGDARWKTALKGEAPEAAALRSDALEWYTPLLQIGDAARRLIDLANAGAPADAAKAQKCLDAIAELRSRFGDLPLVKDRTAAFAKLASLALEKQFDPTKLSSWIHGKVELTGQNVRITYEFENEDELKDFSFDAGYETEWRKDMEEEGRKAPTSNLLVVSGALRGGGSTCTRLPIALAAPMKITANVQFSAGADEGGYASFVRVAAGDDAHGNFVALQGMGGLVVRDRPTGLVQVDYVGGGVTLDADRPYELALSIDGKKATTTVDGQKVKELPCGSRKRGAFFISTYGNAAVAVHRVVVEGALALEETRASWAGMRLAELGLSPQAR